MINGSTPCSPLDGVGDLPPHLIFFIDMCFQSIHSKCPAAARVGFIPVLPTADKIQSKYPAAARVGINPTPTLDVCCIAALCRA